MIYQSLATLYHWAPATVDRLSYAEIGVLLAKPAPAAPVSYKARFRQSWGERMRCDGCGRYAAPKATTCELCGSRLRRFTAAEIGAEWERYQRQKAEKKAAVTRGRKTR